MQLNLKRNILMTDQIIAATYNLLNPKKKLNFTTEKQKCGFLEIFVYRNPLKKFSEKKQ